MEKRSSTIGELDGTTQHTGGAKEYKGHTYLDLARFDDNTKHMIIFDVLTHNSPVGDKGERTRLFLGEVGVSESPGHIRKPVNIKIISHAIVARGNLYSVPQRYGTMTFTLLLAGGDDSCRKKLKIGR